MRSLWPPTIRRWILEIQELLSRLDGVKSRNGGWIARCPSHEDKHQSLSVGVGEDGAWLAFCHAGCTYHAIMDRLGLPASAGFPDTGGRMGEPESSYSYQYEDGTPAYDVLRFPGKSFKARLPDGTWSVKDARKVLYRLPQVLLAIANGETVFVCEGEKDCDAMVLEGYTATCNPFGAGGWKDDYSQSLRGAKVVVVADKDETGVAHAHTVSNSLQGLAESVQIVQAKDGKDASDHLSLGYTQSEFVPLEEVKEDGIVLLRADVAEPEDVQWLDGLENQVAYGVMSMLVGMPGVNKTTWAMRVAAKVCRENQGVLIISAEDSPSVLRGRLSATQANLSLCYFGSVRRNGYDGGVVLLPEDISSLDKTIQEHNVRLLVVDPLLAHLGTTIDSNSDKSVRGAMSPLAAMGIRNHCAILLLMHLNKGMSNDPMVRTGGSMGIPAICRVGLVMGNHPDHDLDENKRVVVGFKNNLGPRAQAEVFNLRLAHAEGYHEPQIVLEWQDNIRMSPARLLKDA